MQVQEVPLGFTAHPHPPQHPAARAAVCSSQYTLLMRCLCISMLIALLHLQQAMDGACSAVMEAKQQAPAAGMSL